MSRVVTSSTIAGSHVDGAARLDELVPPRTDAECDLQHELRAAHRVASQCFILGSLSEYPPAHSTATKRALDHLQYAAFRSDLSLARTPEAVRSFVSGKKAAGRSSELSRYSTAIFCHLHAIRAGFEDFQRHMDDPVVNPPRANNFVRILKLYKGRISSAAAYGDLLQFVQSAISRGQSTASGVEAALRLIVTEADSIFPSDKQRGKAIVSGVRALWEAVKADAALLQESLDTGRLQRAICALSGTRRWNEVEALVLDITKHLSIPQLGQAVKALAALFSRAVAEAGPARRSASSLSVKTEPIRWLVRILTCVPARVAGELVACTSDALRSRAGCLTPPVIPTRSTRTWVATLARVRRLKPSAISSEEWRRVEGAALAGPRPSLRTTFGLMGKGREEASTFIFHRWVADSLETLKDNGQVTVADVRTVNRLFRHHQRRRPCQLSSLHVIDALTRVSIPYAQIVGQLLPTLWEYGGAYDVHRLCQRLIESRTSIDQTLMQKTEQRVARANGQLGLELLKKHVTSGDLSMGLDSCRALLRILIQDPAVSPGQIVDLFLPPGRTTEALPSDVEAYERPAEDTSTDARSCSPTDPIAYLLHAVAYEFAHASHLSARVAFRHVHLCLLIVRSRNQPVRSILTRALTHAGIIRPLRAGAWVNTAGLRVVLRWVTRVEGHEIAAKLRETAERWSQLNVAPTRSRRFQSSLLHRRDL